MQGILVVKAIEQGQDLLIFGYEFKIDGLFTLELVLPFMLRDVVIQAGFKFDLLTNTVKNGRASIHPASFRIEIQLVQLK